MLYQMIDCIYVISYFYSILFIHYLLSGRRQTAEQFFLHLGMETSALSSLLHSELLLEKLLLPKERKQF